MGLFFFIIVFSIQLIVNKICLWLDSNHGSLVSEATTLPTEPPSSPIVSECFCTRVKVVFFKKLRLDILYSFEVWNPKHSLWTLLRTVLRPWQLQQQLMQHLTTTTTSEQPLVDIRQSSIRLFGIHLTWLYYEWIG